MTTPAHHLRVTATGPLLLAFDPSGPWLLLYVVWLLWAVLLWPYLPDDRRLHERLPSRCP